jgi:steroid 5-alpha reductase family enzyme
MDLVGIDYLGVLAINLALIMSAVLLLWLISIRIKDVSIIDMAFAVILFAVAAASARLGNGAEPRQQLIVVLVAIWATRITYHLVKRNWGHGEDVRYSKLRDWVNDDRAFIWLSLKKVFLLQGIVLWLVSLPIQVAQIYPQPAQLGLIALLGAIVCASGLIDEAVADMQLTTFRADPAKKGKVLDTGLWRYSRHPNYFGELCVWWGLFIIACENPLGWLTIVGPLAYTYLIVNVTGQATLDKKMAREKPAYEAYMKSTSGMIPMPPRKSN